MKNEVTVHPLGRLWWLEKEHESSLISLTHCCTCTGLFKFLTSETCRLNQHIHHSASLFLYRFSRVISNILISGLNGVYHWRLTLTCTYQTLINLASCMPRPIWFSKRSLGTGVSAQGSRHNQDQRYGKSCSQTIFVLGMSVLLQLFPCAWKQVNSYSWVYPSTCNYVHGLTCWAHQR